MALFKIQIMDQEYTNVIQWKDKPNGKAALEWAKSQAIEIFGEDPSLKFRYRIEEIQPAA